MTIKGPRAVADLLVSAMPLLSDRLTELDVRARWAALVGPHAARRARPERLEAGCLTVIVDNSPWLHELTLRADELTARLATELSQVRSLRFRLGSVGPVERPTPSPRRRGRSLTADEMRSIDEATSAIPDPTLAAAARRLMTKAQQFPAERGGFR
ncbi:MAG: DciA family protein [Candidatus Rokuibacteriota bacterium]